MPLVCPLLCSSSLWPCTPSKVLPSQRVSPELIPAGKSKLFRATWTIPHLQSPQHQNRISKLSIPCAVYVMPPVTTRHKCCSLDVLVPFRLSPTVNQSLPVLLGQPRSFNSDHSQAFHCCTWFAACSDANSCRSRSVSCCTSFSCCVRNASCGDVQGG